MQGAVKYFTLAGIMGWTATQRTLHVRLRTALCWPVFNPVARKQLLFISFVILFFNSIISRTKVCFVSKKLIVS